LSSYRFDLTRPLAEEVRRVALDELTSALVLLGDASQVDDRAVHEARKHAKKLRALLRLVRGSLPKPLRCAENTLIRDASRRLAGAREAAVCLATYDVLVDGGRGLASKPGVAATRSRLQENHAGATGESVATAVPEVCGVFADVAARVDSWSFAETGFGVVADGLEWVYREGRECLRACTEHADAARLHQWRKRAKDLWYHQRLLVSLWPAVMEARCGELERLSELLGEGHDLDDLHRYLHSRPATSLAAGQIALRRRLLRVRRGLRREALELGRVLYAERPAHFVSGLRDLYRAASQ
jgi:hypothetical protein